MIEIIQKLGQNAEELWREKNYNEDCFPGIAADALLEADIPNRLSAWEIADWALKEIELPEQQDLPARFSDMPITLARFPRFHIDAYFWYDGTTAIHQHSFAGAFQVFEGSSIHSIYGFGLSEKVNFFTEIGEVKLEKAELLKKGDIRQILDGRAFIHALFHLDQPSVTLILRTHRSPLSYPQFSYHKPNLAISPFYEEPAFIKKMQVAAMLLRLKGDDGIEQVSSWLKESDFQTSYAILSNLRHHFSSNELKRAFDLSDNKFEKFLKIAIEKHGEMAKMLPAIFSNESKIDQIARKRSVVTDQDLRFFLALLMNLDKKEDIYILIGERYPQSNPIDKILDWTFELSNTKLLGGSNALGIDNFDDHDLIALEFMLKGWDESTNMMVDSLIVEYNVSDLPGWLKAFPKRKEKIANSAILQSLA